MVSSQIGTCNSEHYLTFIFLLYPLYLDFCNIMTNDLLRLLDYVESLFSMWEMVYVYTKYTHIYT